MTDAYGTVQKNGTATLLARLVNGVSEAAITRSSVSSIVYSVYAMDDSDPDSRAVVTGHSAVSLTVADVVYDTLQTPDGWTADTTGYNFAHTVPIATSAAFTTAGVSYLVEYTITPTSGQKILVRFVLKCV